MIAQSRGNVKSDEGSTSKAFAILPNVIRVMVLYELLTCIDSSFGRETAMDVKDVDPLLALSE